jgi:hypothetical protein
MKTELHIFLQFLRETLLTLPGVTEKGYVGMPAFYVNNKIFTRIREDGETLVLGTLERHKWIKANPNVYFVTDHYLNYDYMLVIINKAQPDELKSLLITAWRNKAPKKLISQYNDKQA